MSDNRDNYWDDEDDEDTQDLSESSLIKNLRKQLKAEQKRAKELESSLGELTKAQKERILKEVLTSRGVNPKIAQYVPSDVEASPDAINSWLDNNADVFGVKVDEKPSVPQQDIDALQKMDSALTGAEATSSDSVEARIAAATSEDEILSILAGQ